MKNSLKFLIVVVAGIIVFACAPIQHIYKVRNISADAVLKQCSTPTEIYPIPVVPYGVVMTVVRFGTGCLGVEDMLLAMWSGNDDEYSETVAKLMILMYINSENLQNEQQLARIFLKKDSFTENEGSYAIIYELTAAKIDEKD